MIAEIGHYALVLALGLALIQAIVPIVGARLNDDTLMGVAGPDRMVDAFAAGLRAEHHPVRLHFYPFGGLARTVEWIANYNATH